MSDFILVKTERDNDQVRRVLKLDPLERLFRKGHIGPDMLRVGRCLQRDYETMHGMGGGSGLARCGEAFVALCRASGNGTAGANRYDRAIEAAGRVQWARNRVGADMAFGVLLELLQGYTPSDLDRRWFLKKVEIVLPDRSPLIDEETGLQRVEWRGPKGTARATVIMALERVTDSQVYEVEKHKVQIWAEGEAVA